tara:strand:+ start:571 stop:1176 length:606 start_codon:yes stop_codon:yes gene_type:complete
MTWICIFGDSISQGHFDTERTGWVARLQLDLWKKDTCIGNHSVSGGTTIEALKIMKPIFRVEWPDLVIFALGDNDSRYTETTKNNFTPFTDFKANIKKLIKIAKTQTSKIVFVGPTPVDESKTNPIPWETTEYYRNKDGKKYSEATKSICSDHKIPFLDIHKLWLKTDYKKLLEDGLHPNTEGHKLLYKQISAFLKANKLI